MQRSFLILLQKVTITTARKKFMIRCSEILNLDPEIQPRILCNKSTRRAQKSEMAVLEAVAHDQRLILLYAELVHEL